MITYITLITMYCILFYSDSFPNVLSNGNCKERRAPPSIFVLQLETKDSRDSLVGERGQRRATTLFFCLPFTPFHLVPGPGPSACTPPPLHQPTSRFQMPQRSHHEESSCFDLLTRGICWSAGWRRIKAYWQRCLVWLLTTSAPASPPTPTH